MNLEFHFCCRRPLGRMVDQLLERMDHTTLTVPCEIDIDEITRSRGEAIALAESAPEGICSVRCQSGKISVSWRYGPRAWVQGLDGNLRIRHSDLAAIRVFLSDLALLGGCFYGYADLRSTAENVFQEAYKKRLSLTPSDSFYSIFWYNYFGAEYRDEFPPIDMIQTLVSNLEILPNGALVVESRARPNDAVDEVAIERVAWEWPG